MKNKIFFVLRFLIALVFIASGYQKTSAPYQNFLYIIHGYELLPTGLDVFAAKVVPWVEWFVGLFLLFGLWTRHMLNLSACLFLSFIVFIVQALVRGIDLSECGCFGELIQIPPQVTLGMDVVFFAICVLLSIQINVTKYLSLDQFCEKK